MADSETRRRRAHVAGTAAGAVAGAASAPFGAAKLRDSYRESYPARFERGLRRVEHVARREGMTQQQTSRALRLASHGKPGFVPLITATTAATAAGGARRYERHQERKVAKSAFGVEHPNLEVSKELTPRQKNMSYDAKMRRVGWLMGRVQGSVHAHSEPTIRERLSGERSGPSMRQHLTASKINQATKGVRGMNTAYKTGYALDRYRLPRKIAVAGAATGAVAGAVHHRGRKVAKSAFGVEMPIEKADRRRAVEVGAGGGAVLAARGAQKSRRAARGHLVRAADLERDSNSSFHAARGQGTVVTQRLQRHVSSGPGSLPRTSGNLANTGRAHLKQQAHLHNGLAARDASHAAAAAGRTALGRSRGKLALAGGLVAVSGMASTRRHRY